MPTWPVTLPDDILVQGFSEGLPANTIRTPMDTGPAKLRRRSTAAPRPVKGQQYMTAAQVAILETFYVTTLLSGSLSFDWTSPRTDAAEDFRFVQPPAWTPQGIGWMVTLELEQLP